MLAVRRISVARLQETPSASEEPKRDKIKRTNLYKDFRVQSSLNLAKILRSGPLGCKICNDHDFNQAFSPRLPPTGYLYVLAP